MKVGLNATCFNNRPSGARQRFTGIYGELIKRLPDVEFVVFEPADCNVASWFDGAPNVSSRQTPIPSEGRTERFFSGLRYWPTALLRERFDIFEGFNLPLVSAPSGRTLLTIHDIRRIHSDWGMLERVAYKTVLRNSLSAADHVITVSEAMKNEILGFFSDVPISVLYNGLDAREYDAVSESDRMAVRLKYALPQEFILSVGHLERRKNYLELVDAIAHLRDRGRSCCLVIIGNDSGERNALDERVAYRGLSDSVKILSGLSDPEVRCVYKLCTLFVFPSSYEGFGIPTLEAMAANCPMVLSNIPVFREITQDRGIYFPPHDAESMASVIEKVLSSSSERARLVEYGSERVRTFTFGSLAAQLERLYGSLTQ